MNSLKIQKGEPEAANQRRTDNTIAKRKRTNDKQYSTKHTKIWVYFHRLVGTFFGKKIIL
jgi:hypothetical protein